MSYRIQYHSEPVKAQKKGRCDMEISAVTLLILITALMVSLLMPVQLERLRETLFPWTQEQVHEALERFQDHVASGAPLGDSITAFCVEIMDDATQ